MSGGKKSPAQLDYEIDQALAHGVDTVMPRRLAGQPLPTRRPAPAPHGVDTVRPRRGTGTSHARKKINGGGAKRALKTKIIYVVQGNYGYGHGWEDLTAEDERKEALARLREYRENESAPFRLIRRRERIAA